MPDLVRLAHEVAETGQPRVLREHGAEIAVLSPVSPTRRSQGKKPGPEVVAAALAAAGGWKDLVDTERLKAEIKAARGSRRPPVRL